MFVINFVMLTFRLLGLAPMTISQSQVSNHWNPKKKISKMTFSWSWVGAVYNLGLIGGISVECYLQIPQMIQRGAMDKSLLSQMYRNTMIVCANSFLVILFLIFCLRQRKLIVIGNRFIDIDSALDQLHGIYKLKSGKTYILFVLVLNLIFTMMFIGIRLAMGQNMVMGFMTMIVFNCTIFSFYILQYALVVFVIERRFRCLNEALSNLETKTFMIKESNRSHLVRNDQVVVSIIVIKRAYGRLYKLCSEISNFYAPLTIFIVIYFSTALLYILYGLFVGFVGGHFEGVMSVKFLGEFLWISLRSYPFILLTNSVRKTHIEMQKTSDITHKLQAKYKAHRQIKTELKNFTTDLMYRNFQFTAYGIFPMDCSLLKSVVSTITTYLIIFVQFQLASNKQEEKMKE